MTPSQSERIMTQLATLAEGVASLRREFAEQFIGVRRDIGRQDQAFELERQDSHLSRKDLHDKVNGVVEDVGALKGDVRIAAEITAQTRETVKDLNAKFEATAPTIAQVEQAKRVGVWVLGGGGLAAMAAVTTVFVWGEGFKAWLAHWLGIR